MEKIAFPDQLSISWKEKSSSICPFLFWMLFLLTYYLLNKLYSISQYDMSNSFYDSKDLLQKF